MDKKKIKLSIKVLFSVMLIISAYCYIGKYVPAYSKNQKIADMISIIIQMGIVIYTLIKDEYDMKKSECESLIIGGLIGFSIALIFIGVRTLNPTNLGWIMSETDRAQHFLGWNFFKNDSWHFPLGYFNNWASPNGMSIIFTDSIPIVAIVMKFFRSFLPQVFQYLGIWLFLSFTLMGAFSAKLFSKVTHNLSIKALISVFFVANPLVFQRVGGHTALTSQWLLLWALYLIIYGKYNKKNFISWILLILLSLVIHPYFLFMVYIVFLTYLVKGMFVERRISIKKGVSLIGITVVLTLCIMYVNGYFMVDAEMDTIGFGLAGFNINSFFNPIGTSRYLKTLSMLQFQHEAMAYLGLGGILGVVILIVDVVKNGLGKENKKLKITLLCMSIIFVIAATSNRITYFEHSIVIPIGGFLTKIWSIVRCTGRLIWPVWYLIIFCIFVRIIKSVRDNTKVQIIVGFLVVLQLLDFSYFFMNNRNSFINEKKWNSTLVNEFWIEAADKYKHVAFVEKIPNYEELAYYVSINDMDMDYGYFAREPKTLNERLKQNAEDILSGNFKKDTLYIITYQDKLISKILDGPHKEYVKEIDGQTVFAP